VATKKTRAQLEAEIQILRSDRSAQGVYSVVKELVRWGAMVLIAYFGFRSLEVLAGKTTSSNIFINLLTDLRANSYFAILFGGGGVFYGYRQRKLRRDTAERLQTRIKDYELKLDPKRSSSRLTIRGDTRPEDKP
jgi:hypothetical protein